MMKIEPSKNLYRYIPDKIVDEVGITDDRKDARKFSESLFQAGARAQISLCDRVIKDLPLKADWKDQENHKWAKAYEAAIDKNNIQDTRNALTYGYACFLAGKRFIFNSFAGKYTGAALPF